MNLLQKAQAYLHLTPSERATLKTFYSLFISALAAGAMIGGGYIFNAGNVDWKYFTSIVIFGIVVAFGHGLAKYVTATGDTMLGNGIEAVTNEVEKKEPQPLQGVQGPLVVIHQNSATTSVETPIPVSQPVAQSGTQSVASDAQEDVNITTKLPALSPTL